MDEINVPKCMCMELDLSSNVTPGTSIGLLGQSQARALVLMQSGPILVLHHRDKRNIQIIHLNRSQDL